MCVCVRGCASDVNSCLHAEEWLSLSAPLSSHTSLAGTAELSVLWHPHCVRAPTSRRTHTHAHKTSLFSRLTTGMRAQSHGGGEKKKKTIIKTANVSTIGTQTPKRRFVHRQTPPSPPSTRCKRRRGVQCARLRLQ